MKIPSNYLWQWVLVLSILYVMINGIDFMFGKKLTVEDNNKIEETINQKVDRLGTKLDSIIQELQEIKEIRKGR